MKNEVKTYTKFERLKYAIFYPIALLADGGVCAIQPNQKEIDEDISNLWFVAKHGYDSPAIINRSSVANEKVKKP